MKDGVFKNRKLIWYSIQNKIENVLELNDISVVGNDKTYPVKLILFCHKKIKENLPDQFTTVILYGGDCQVNVETFEYFEKKLINDSKLLDEIEKYYIIYDTKNKFRKMIESAKKKSNWPWIVKILF